MKREHFDAVIDYFTTRDRLSGALNRLPLVRRISRQHAFRIAKWVALQRLLRKYPVDPRREPGHIADLLQDALPRRDRDQVAAAMLLGFVFGFSRSCLPVLHTLLTEDWHISHEDIASVLQDLHSPTSIDVLYRAAQMQFDYLDYDEFFSLARKCCGALGAIGTAEAVERLRDLAQSENPVKAKTAARELRHRNKPLRA